ncbi:MAG: hypothetical protein Q9M97_09705 [Candidatus Gracilibacteria bacterium]|nr:hypothetical protein [Candidatus Gracilibacteria bacterium]
MINRLFFSNKDKKVVRGIELFGASIITDNGLKIHIRYGNFH